ncbi:MAG: isocitrate lyase/phosphoenolpyruvate mutase family protein [Candidatus Zixiibacteriota bacterium]|nr:MAG: isocitrate lyase/phosphoenolpyruvate mutase family protein [candidate division Zixibacteria bacterium]
MTKKPIQKKRAEVFRALHQAPLFVLANVWDVASARIFETAGFKALGTTSAGVAATLGYPDGQHIKIEATVDVVRRLVDRTGLPVSADIEAGYGPRTEDAVESARVVLEAGAVGINLEDSTGDPENPLFDTTSQQEKIRAIKKLTTDQGVGLLVNARTDVFMLSKQDISGRLKATIERANAYIEAGADCIFVPDLEDMDTNSMKTLVAEIDAPLNLIAGSNTPPLDELREIGITRVSLGPRHMRATFALLKKIASEIMEKGTFSTMTTETMSYSEVNRMFEADD